jgi:hypothetical protein
MSRFLKKALNWRYWLARPAPVARTLTSDQNIPALATGGCLR